MIKHVLPVAALAAVAALGLAGCGSQSSTDQPAAAPSSSAPSVSTPSPKPVKTTGEIVCTGLANGESTDTALAHVQADNPAATAADLKSVVSSSCPAYLPKIDPPAPVPTTPSVTPFGSPATFVAGSESRPALTITVAKPVTATGPDSKYGEAPKNGQYVTVTVTVKADPASKTDDTQVNPLDFYLVTTDGSRYERDNGNVIGSVDLDNRLGMATLNPGEKITGTLSFDIPKGAYKIVYAPDSRALSYWGA